MIVGLPSHFFQSDQDRRRHVDSGHPRQGAPARHGVDLEHDQPAEVEIRDQVDAGHLGPDRAGGRQRQTFRFRIQPASSALPPSDTFVRHSPG